MFKASPSCPLHPNKFNQDRPSPQRRSHPKLAAPLPLFQVHRLPKFLSVILMCRFSLLIPMTSVILWFKEPCKSWKTALLVVQALANTQNMPCKCIYIVGCPTVSVDVTMSFFLWTSSCRSCFPVYCFLNCHHARFFRHPFWMKWTVDALLLADTWR